jgi:hypothetical protein
VSETEREREKVRGRECVRERSSLQHANLVSRRLRCHAGASGLALALVPGPPRPICAFHEADRLDQGGRGKLERETSFIDNQEVTQGR